MRCGKRFASISCEFNLAQSQFSASQSKHCVLARAARRKIPCRRTQMTIINALGFRSVIRSVPRPTRELGTRECLLSPSEVYMYMYSTVFSRSTHNILKHYRYSLNTEPEARRGGRNFAVSPVNSHIARFSPTVFHLHRCDATPSQCLPLSLFLFISLFLFL